jgi:hypothetical protein
MYFMVLAIQNPGMMDKIGHGRVLENVTATSS